MSTKDKLKALEQKAIADARAEEGIALAYLKAHWPALLVALVLGGLIGHLV